MSSGLHCFWQESYSNSNLCSSIFNVNFLWNFKWFFSSFADFQQFNDDICLGLVCFMLIVYSACNSLSILDLSPYISFLTVPLQLHIHIVTYTAWYFPPGRRGSCGIFSSIILCFSVDCIYYYCLQDHWSVFQ